MNLVFFHTISAHPSATPMAHASARVSGEMREPFAHSNHRPLNHNAHLGREAFCLSDLFNNGAAANRSAEFAVLAMSSPRGGCA
jgi:hypothetical protein